MKFPVPDSLFVRLFLLLFFVLSLSNFAGREIFLYLGLEHPVPGIRPQHHGLVSFIARLVAIALTAWVGARWLSNPIKHMARAADELGKNLNSPTISETSGPSEVRQASKVFNQMQARLKQQMEERNHFLAAVSHDLRTPLTRLKLRAEKMDQHDLRTDVQNDLNEMAEIIDTTLGYLRGDEQPEATYLLDIGALVHSLAEDAGDVITVSGNARPIRLQPLSIRRCLNNLIGNALRYGERAAINISETDEEILIAIHDEGPGIPEDKLETVFTPFYRIDASRSRHTGGIGLGLSIARDMAGKQGGKITLKNAPEGGLVATLALPKRH
ncbi:MAG: Sensor histidine kinase [Candidatus Gallionella acididurans]|uniref:histidine kinase n=1 Tax=Candidatus Gallionella acididurans TaxID=1796491 RepID=A0A139BUG6_9PROT|nr:MAG: Sensor histidine kinase [Candidatus Gallionella acididurans]